jgi:sortase (surface protein transpeptidase)
MKKHFRILALGIAGLAFFVFAVTTARSLWYSRASETSLSPPEEVQTPSSRDEDSDKAYGKPVRLRIPTLAIEADIEHVGVNRKGNMAVPATYGDVAWYKHGATPGERGSAVIAGHVDNGLGLAAVFKRLKDIRIGEKIFITTESGEALVFTVEGIADYPYTNAPLDHIFSRDDKPRLNLITCVGEWIPTQKTYDERLVVYAVREGKSRSRR